MAVIKKIRKNGTDNPIGADAQNVSYSGDVAGATNVKDALDALAAGGGSIPDMSQYGYYGENYPVQMNIVKNVLDQDKNSSYPQLHFIHISDSHSANIGEADDLLENTAADFIAHTGDGVGGKYGDGVEALYQKMLGCSKPVYYTIGNHDFLPDTSQSPVVPITTEDCYNQYIKPLVDEGWVSSNGKTYYAKDIIKSGTNNKSANYKCIFLDQADGLEYVDGVQKGGHENVDVIAGNMTDTQIEWFVNQLRLAMVNNQHVMVFLHVKPDDLIAIQGWQDHITSQKCGTIGTMLMDIVAAFKIRGSYEYKKNGVTVATYNFSGSFSVDNTTYTIGSGVYGIFVGWFAGHTHHDEYGYCKTHPDQFVFVTTKPYNVEISQWDGNKGGHHINYITVDYQDRRVCLYRMGVQQTWMGTKREAFYVTY